MDGNSMIQVIYEDGTKARFTKEIIPCEKKIKFKKVLTESEILKIPDTSSGKLVMRDKNTEELQSEQDARQVIIDKSNIEKLIEDKKRKIAIDELINDGILTQDQVDKLS